MGDLALDTTIEQSGDDRYIATPANDWDIWGPNGGYMAALALRAAGAHTAFARPVSLACHFIKVARFEPVEMRVTSSRPSARAESLRVSMTQGEEPILDALIWTAADAGSTGRCWTPAPEIPRPADVPTLEELAAAQGFPALPFWKNIEIRTLQGPAASSEEPQEPVVVAWNRFRPQAVFADPWVAASRALVLIDVHQFPAVTRGFARSELTFMAPSLDLYVAFHGHAPDDEWLLSESRGLVCADGLLAGGARVWSSEGLLASGGQQMLQRSFKS
jgi:acyl-CoA thioesterase II